MTPSVLIVGAGPTGLALALSLERRNISFRIIDAADGPGTASRAIAVQARTLEMYDQYGIGQGVVDSGLILKAPTLWMHGQRRAIIPFADFGRDQSPHPYILMYPQDAHERYLLEALKTRVEYGVALEGFEQDANGVTAHLSSGETVQAAYICGCDGAHSAVRRTLGLNFPGGTYDALFYVADVDATTVEHADEFYFFLKGRGFLLVLPLPGGVRFRLIGIVPKGFEAKTDLRFEDIADEVLSETPLRVQTVHWFSTYHVHHRVVAHFRRGRAFLAGDAAHIHSPAGGQGMNTGIGDAFNLGWKLAQVLNGGPDALLDTYETERHAFARKLVQTTDRLFLSVVGPGLWSKFVRLVLFPFVLPFVMTFTFFRSFVFRTVSQLVIAYPHSALSAGSAGALQAGMRLPWTGENFDALAANAWQLHVYGRADAQITSFCTERGLALHVYEYSNKAEKQGFVRDTAYLVRPDGYIGFIGKKADALRRYCETWRI